MTASRGAPGGDALRAWYDLLHRRIDDVALDEAAARVGLPSGIGRWNLLDDATLQTLVARVLPKRAGRVLDIGCGRGFLGRWLLANGYDFSYVGLDRSPNALAAAARNCPKGRYLLREAADLPDETFDAVAIIESVHPLDESLARAVARRLSQGGGVLLAFPSLESERARRVDASVAAFVAAGLEVERVRVACPPGAEGARGYLDVLLELCREDSDSPLAREIRRAVDCLDGGLLGYDAFVARGTARE
ncbi:MAG TPA: class I SAM-dependent methyltransferase [Verrucomicrobiae bacterium]|nr:class I SAM-dependent methyltransferase [Verrucomicrobiae bacterium]